MKELENKITDLIISKINIEAAAKAATETILESKEFSDKFEERMLEFRSYNGSLIERVYSNCIDKLADKYIEKHGDKILAQVDPATIANGIMFQAINKTQDKMAAR